MDADDDDPLSGQNRTSSNYSNYLIAIAGSVLSSLLHNGPHVKVTLLDEPASRQIC